MPRQLILLRHAKSSWKRSEVPDHERGLNARGERDAPRIGGQLQRHGLQPDFIASSTARRARVTAKLVARALHFKGDRWLYPELYLATPDGIVEVLRGAPPDSHCVLAVGHNPGWEALASLLTGEPCTMPTAAWIALELPITEWTELRVETHGRRLAISCPAND